MTNTNRMKPRWERDPDADGDRYATWALMPAGTSQSDEQYVAPLATVNPVWAGSTRMSGAPSHWTVTAPGVAPRRYAGVKEAKTAVEALLAAVAS